jgi:hypothetical protein
VKQIMAALVLMASLPTLAALPIRNFGAQVDLGSDVQSALHLSFTVWSPPLEQANQLAGEAHVSASDFSVTAFLANRSGWSLQAVWNLRRSGLSWAQVSVRVGVPLDHVVVRTTKRHGPPYGVAWGYWHNKGKKGKPRVTDSQFVRMVEVRTLARAGGLTPDQIIERMRKGESYRRFAAGLYREKFAKGRDSKGGHGKGAAHGGKGKTPPGKGKEHGGGEGRSHGHGHGKGW